MRLSRGSPDSIPDFPDPLNMLNAEIAYTIPQHLRLCQTAALHNHFGILTPLLLLQEQKDGASNQREVEIETDPEDREQ
jgi:hypothetical protein